MTGRVGSALVALCAFAGCVSYSGGARPVDPSRLGEPGWIVAAPTPELRQPGSRDCGAAALAMIAGRWHVPFTVADAVAALPAPTSQGIQLGDLRNAARARGFTAFAVSGDRETLIHELEAGRPVIVGLLLPYGREHLRSHYEVIVAVHPTEDRFVTINPASGWRIRSWTELDAEWRPARRPTLVVLGHAGHTPVHQLRRPARRASLDPGVAAPSGPTRRLASRGSAGSQLVNWCLTQRRT